MLAGLAVPGETDSSILAGQGAGNRVEQGKGQCFHNQIDRAQPARESPNEAFCSGGTPALVPRCLNQWNFCLENYSCAGVILG